MLGKFSFFSIQSRPGDEKEDWYIFFKILNILCFELCLQTAA